jgi:hypothetical protein
MAFNAVSSFSVQNEVDKVRTFALLEPIFNVSGYSTEPALTIATDVMTAICAVNFPHKWNEVNLPQFYTNSFQQDYALVNSDGSSVLNVEWLERGVAFDINNTSIPKPWVSVECGRSQQQRTATFFNSGTFLNNPGFIATSLPNYLQYYGVWGAPDVGNATLGNNPKPGSVYTSPLASSVITASWLASQATFTVTYIPNAVTVSSTINVSGVFPNGYNGNWTVVSIDDTTNPSQPTITVTMPVNPGVYQAGGIINNSAAASQPKNPITQIIDANGNFLVLTTYGTEGTTPPVLAKDALPGTKVSGTGATTVWTVLDPNGLGIRILDVPSQTGVVWQFNIVGQKPPVIFQSLNQKLTPLPDKYEPFFRAGFIAQAYRYSPEAKIRAKFETEWKFWLASLQGLREVQDRELEEYQFVPDRSVMGGGTSRSKFVGPANPFNYPRL